MADVMCWYGKTAGVRCERPGKWRWAGKFWSDWVKASVWCDEHRSGANVAVCQHPMHDDDCMEGCVNPAPACAYCQKTDDVYERKDEDVCGQCGEDLDRGDEMDRQRDAYEAHVDQKLSEWKENRATRTAGSKR